MGKPSPVSSLESSLNKGYVIYNVQFLVYSRAIQLYIICPWNFPGKNTGAGCHFLLWDLPDPAIEPVSLVSPALAGGFFTTSTTWEAQWMVTGGTY